MSRDRYQFEPLGSHHNRAAFSCGVESLDHYFRRQAGQDVRRRLAAVFVLHDSEAPAVVGYYTLSAISVEPAELPPETVRKLPRYRFLPAVLLGRLAVDQSYRGQGFGELLLLDALYRALEQSNQIGAMAVIVDAKDEPAQAFYERYGFQRFLEEPFRLFIPMATIDRLGSS